MTGILTINDMAVQTLAWRGGILTVVSDSDPLLRRFGQCDIIRIKADEALEVLRRQADEVWAVIVGQAEMKLEDRREDSPSSRAVQELELDEKLPQAILVPFGVRMQITARSDAVLVRLTTHEDSDHSGDLLP